MYAEYVICTPFVVIHFINAPYISLLTKMDKQKGVVGRGIFDLSFARYVSLALQSPYSIIVTFVYQSLNRPFLLTSSFGHRELAC